MRTLRNWPHENACPKNKILRLCYAKVIAERLTTAYSDHGYVVDFTELQLIGMQNAEEATNDIEGILETIAFMECQSTILGPLMEKTI